MSYYCLKCNKTGYIERGGKLYDCECSFVHHVVSRMPAYIKSIEYKNEHTQLGVIKHIDKHLYIKSTWNDMKAVIKILFITYANKFIKIISDVNIRDVYVGSASKSAKSSDYEGEVFNNLQDLIEPPDLLIIKLGDLFNKNKAAPGALLESIKYRLDYDKPMWVWTDINHPFGQGSYAYSEQMMELIYATHKSVEIPRILAADNYASLTSSNFISNSPIPNPNPNPNPNPITTVESSFLEPVLVENRKPRKPVQKDIGDEEDEKRESINIYGQGNKKKSSWKK